MTYRDDFVDAVRAVDARIEGMRERIVAAGDTPLPEGTWRVRDALSHLAARSNGVARVMQRVEAASAAPGGDAPAPPRNIDEVNAGQVEERSDRSVEDLLREIAEGHRAAIEAVTYIDDSTLERRIELGFRPGDASVGELLTMGGPRHDGAHLDQVEAALGASA
ncbi:MAG: maleylpyruvate isomerase N-terminal domain-containing protein [Dehalococcoidia bacterium]